MNKNFSDTVQILEAGLRIDEHKLDQSLLTQPDSFWRVSKLLAMTISERDAAKQDLILIEAEQDAEIRHRAQVDGEKITEKEIESLKRVSPKVDKAAKILHDLNEQVGILSALKESLTQRGYVLKTLAELYIANYYGGETGQTAGRTARDQRQEDNRESYVEKRRNRK